MKRFKLAAIERSKSSARTHIGTINAPLGDLYLLSMYHGANGPEFPATPQAIASLRSKFAMLAVV